MDDSASVSARQARADLTRLLDRATVGEPTVITRGGIAVAAIVPMSGCNALEEAADELLSRKALRTLAEEGDAPRATLADLLADLLADIFGRPAPDGV
ncbi:type II toxin-antitoxin system Phd/YefM family antitoxin [Streptomyces sp. NPDC051665]|uniref:type II toxin-antitoxin system Phd/YefM family antitoxin n=1 Tax=Streptomyces sp. NPDC051665 TaxID=3154647 RepID=UPI00343A8C6B